MLSYRPRRCRPRITKTLAAASPEFLLPVEVAETDIATLNYTSGTTARPKG
jgi:long-subunit acyl-CoA synthetase (AMP-forming)